MNSGCSHHTCPNREWFSNFKEMNGEVVLMGDNSHCRTQEINTIRLKIHDEAVRDLINKCLVCFKFEKKKSFLFENFKIIGAYNYIKKGSC